MEGQKQQISAEAIGIMCAEFGETKLMLAEANVRLAQQARRIAELEAPAPVATLEGARERRKAKDSEPESEAQDA